ncbi:hypothetical protein [Paractinoplanes rishiriensis]|uniref:Uncharacterized protein n=1 Tax=Paractinoplanes rishiriensis TaxID=1050105 RepID=A0A919MWW7_9ACTN|nr:hypothetical protein [Actinoplanes rishiriensis]GIE95090.1 hypothetical protein Ari01nite_25550 [Actinoplanes rishiriensis]
MSLTSLRGYAGLASNALDTARSTFKAMADAAVQPEAGGAAPDAEPKAIMKSEAPAAPAAAEQPAPKPADQPRKGVRRGVALDAYA